MTDHAKKMPQRAYGRAGDRISIIGFGGIIVMNESQDRADSLVAQAVAGGINYFDVAPTYGDAQAKLGPALQPFREHCFLACKTTDRTAAGSAKELKESLRALRTDHLDLYQLHALKDVAADVDVAFAPGGAMETFLAAKKNGEIRHLGFSAHTEEAAVAAMDRYPFDSILFPVNYAMYYHGFGRRTLELARRHGTTILALKMQGRQRWTAGDPRRGDWPKCWYEPIVDETEMELAARFTLGQPGVAAALPGGDERLFRAALQFAERFQPLNREEETTLRTLAEKVRPIFPE